MVIEVCLHRARNWRATGLGRARARVRRTAPLGLHLAAAALLMCLCALGAGRAALAESATLIGVPSGCRIEEGQDPFIGQEGPCQGKLVLSNQTFMSVGSDYDFYKRGGNGDYAVKFDGRYYGMGDWYTGNITDMSFYFWQAPKDVFEQVDHVLGGTPIDFSIDEWDTQNVVNMRGMFFDAKTPGDDMSNWDLSSLKHISIMFSGAYNFNASLHTWDVSNISDFSSVFVGASSFNSDISGWDVSNATSMAAMFSGAKSFQGDLSDWDVSNVTNMYNMFGEAESFNSDIGGWDVGKVEDMDYMFHKASSFNRDLSGWEVRMLDEEPSYFDRETGSFWTSSEKPDWDRWVGVGQPAPVVVKLLPQHAASSVTPGSDLFLFFDREVEANAGTISIVDGFSGEVFAAFDVNSDQVVVNGDEVKIIPPRDFSPGRTYMVLFDEGTFQGTTGKDVAAFVEGDWPDTEGDWHFAILAEGCVVDLETQESFVGQVEPCVNKLVISPEDFYAVGSRHVGGDESYSHQLIALDATPTSYGPNAWYVGNITDMSNYFRGYTRPSHMVDKWDVSNVSDMSYMFAENTQLVTDFYNWDVSSVTNMEGMFYKTTWIHLAELAHPWLGDSYWDTSSLENTSKMFYEAIDFNQDIARWDMSGVTDTSQMFYGATSYNQDLSPWDTSQVTNMSEMFRGASAFDQDLSEWDLDEVTDMSGMFQEASAFNSDIGDWYLGEVTNMENMFQDASAFDQDISTWDVSQISSEPAGFDTNTSQEWTEEEKPRWGTSGDKIPPVLLLHSPVDDATNAEVDAEFALFFSETVVAGQGAVRIYEASGDQVEAIDVSSDAAEFSGSSLIFNLSAPLAYQTDYYVLIDEAAIEDVDRNAFAGISDPEAWTFTTGQDTDAPTLVSTVPADGASEVDIDAELTLTFSEEVQAGVGSIDLYDTATNTLMQSLAVDGAQVTFAGASLTLSPSSFLTYQTDYSVVIPDAAIVDASPNRNAFAGLSGASDATSWRFTTEDAPISAANSSVEADPSDAVPVTGSSTIWVTLRDNEGHVVGGLASLISGSTSHSEASLGTFAEQADAVGVYSATLTSTAAGAVEVTLAVGDITLDATATVNFTSVPDAPSDFVVIPGDGVLDLSWTAPFDGGAEIEGYEYSLNEGGDYMATGSTATRASVSVANGVPYAVTVRAVSAQGASADAAVVSVPSVTVRSDASSPVESSFIVEVVFSEGVSGFSSSDLRLSNAFVGPITGSDGDEVYSFEVRAIAEGEVAVGLVANAAVNADGWGNTASDLLSRTYDLSGPVFDQDGVDSEGYLAFSVAENTTSVFATVSADDAHGPVTYALGGGDDAAHFAITQTGELSFDLDGGGDFEDPADADGDNIYTFEVLALDGASPANSTAQNVKVTVTNVFEGEEGSVVTIEQEDGGTSVDVSAQGLEIPEGETEELILTLVEQPQATVQVDVASNDAAVALIRVGEGGQSFDADATTLRFEPATWDTPQVLTFVAVARDDLADHATTIALDFSGSSDADYASVGTTDFGVTSINTTEPGIEVSGAGEVLQLDEGESGTFAVWLTAIPSQELTLSVGSDNEGVATVDLASLTFDADNWDQAQTVTVTGVDHSALSDQATEIRIAAPNGTEFAGVEARKTIQVTNTTAPTLDVTYPGSEQGENLSVEEGSSTSFEFALAGEPTDAVTVKLALVDTDAITVAAEDQGDTLVFEPGDWDQPQTVTVTGVEDHNSVSEAGLAVTLVASGGGYAAGVDDVTVLVDVIDTDTPELAVSLSSITVAEGGTARFDVRLMTAPSGDVTVTLTSEDVEAVGLSAATGLVQDDGSLDLTFAPEDWGDAQEVIVTGLEDADTRDESQIEVQISAKGQEYEGVTEEGVSVSVMDDDAAALAVSTYELNLSEGFSDSFAVVLLTEPSGDVTVTLAPEDVGAIGLSGTTGSLQQDGSLVLTFARQTWDVAQEVTVTGVVDGDTQNESTSISLSAAGQEYDGLTAGPIEVSVEDASSLGFIISETDLSLTVAENSTTTLTLALATQPISDVEVGLRVSDAGAIWVAALATGADRLTFTSTTWSTPQTIEVTGLDDDDALDETGLDLYFEATGAEYEGFSETLKVDVDDDDSVGLSVSETSLVLDEDEEGAFTLALTSRPSADVTVKITPGTSTVASPINLDDDDTVTFTPDEWSEQKTIKVKAGVDNNLEQNRTVLTLAIEGSEDADYSGLGPSYLTVTVSDTTVPEILVDASGLSLTEGGTGTFFVSLNAEPADEVSVDLVSTNTSFAIVETARLVFDNSDWFEPQTVTLSAPDDDNFIHDDALIRLSASGSGFDAALDVELPVTVIDSSEVNVQVSETSLSLLEGEGGSLFLSLGREPTADVVLNLSGEDASLVTLSPSEVTFTTADWAESKEVEVRAVDNDDLGDGEVSLTLSSASSADSDYAGLDDQEIVVTIRDDETVALVTDVSVLTVAEGEVGSFALQLSARPTSDVSILLGTVDTSVLTVSPTEVSIAVANWDQPHTVNVTAAAGSISEDTVVAVNFVALTAEFAGVAHSIEVTVSNQSAQAQDTGALVSSMATSGVMGTQMGNAINDAVAGGVRGGSGSLGAVAGGSYDGSQGSYDPEAYNRLHVLSARQSDTGFTLVDWFSVGLSQASLDAELAGDGSFAYALIGKELTKTRGGVSGVLYGAETSSWDYEDETDVDRTGFSVGYYTARQSGGLTFSGSAIWTLSLNDFVSNSGATGDAQSSRWIFKGGVSGERAMGRRGAKLKPYMDLMYATETLGAFDFSDGTSSQESTANLGRLGLGLEYATAPSASGSRLLVRGELSQVFGSDDITLSDGTVYSPNEDAVGSVTFGWLTRPGTDTTAQIELTFGELGNDEAEEIRLDGTVDRRF